ncbi:MAG: membrane lipoprotein lipid attachment site-containing protein [Mucilaginibacter sp.]
MKKILFVATAIVFLAACKKDVKTQPADASIKITGKWQNNYKFTVTRDSVGTILSTDTIIVPGILDSASYQFNADNTWVHVTYNDAPYTVSRVQGTYKIESNKTISFTANGKTTDWVITTLTPNRFVFAVRKNYSYEGKTIYRTDAIELTR